MDSAYGTDDDSNTIMIRNEDNLIEDQEDEQDDLEDESQQLPGFRFYPTDEELVDFYLKRKVENKPFSLDLIKEIDIYKYDPWDLPKSSSVGDNEWYIFCKRGRKYRNSVRPNRVTGSGFWKATGIDKPIHSNNNNVIVGLKKSLVYYLGNAGKGNKTDWMMHEFRLPNTPEFIIKSNSPLPIMNDTDTTQEAEVWTVCRIFKRNVPSRKYTSNWREISTKRSIASTSKELVGADVVMGSSNSSPEQAWSTSSTRRNNKSTTKGESFISFSNYTTASNDDNIHQPEAALGLIQNPNYNSKTSSHSQQLGHEQYGSSSNYQQGTSSNDQLVGGTQESWDELTRFWSSFRDQ